MIKKIQYRIKWMFFNLLTFIGFKPSKDKRKGELQVVCFHVDSKSIEAKHLRRLFDEKESFKISGNTLNHSLEISKIQFNLFEMDII